MRLGAVLPVSADGRRGHGRARRSSPFRPVGLTDDAPDYMPRGHLYPRCGEPLAHQVPHAHREVDRPFVLHIRRCTSHTAAGSRMARLLHE